MAPAASSSLRRSCSTRAASGSITSRATRGCCTPMLDSSEIRSITATSQSISLSFQAGPVFPKRRCPVCSRGDSQEAAKHCREMTRGPKPKYPRDLSDRERLRGQARTGTGDPLPHHKSVWRHAGAALEEAREVIRTHENDRGELAERQVLVEVLLNVLGHALESGPREGTVVRLCRRHWHLLPVETLEWLDSIWSQSNFAGRKGLPDVGRDPLRPYFGRDRLLPESALLTTASPRPTIYLLPHDF